VETVIQRLTHYNNFKSNFKYYSALLFCAHSHLLWWVDVKLMPWLYYTDWINLLNVEALVIAYEYVIEEIIRIKDPDSQTHITISSLVLRTHLKNQSIYHLFSRAPPLNKTFPKSLNIGLKNTHWENLMFTNNIFNTPFKSREKHFLFMWHKWLTIPQF